MKFWKQKVELIAGGKEFKNDHFEIDFGIEFSDSPEPNISEVKIFNLSKQTISSIKGKDIVILNAGYGNDIGNILNGKIEKVESYWEGVDKVTELTVGDGADGWGKAKHNLTYAKGTTAKAIISDLAGKLGLEIGEISLTNNIVYKNGRTITQQLQKALRSVVDDTDSRLFIDKGKLYIRPPTKGTITGFLLNSDTGLVGSPQVIEEEDGKGNKVVKYNVECLLNHLISTDSIIKIESKTISGNYKVVKGRYNGDFTMKMEVIPY